MTGLYAIPPDLADSGALFAKVEAALEGGARVPQYCNKVADSALRLEQALGLARLCRTYHVPLIINDHLELALEVDAEGLHIGAEDGSIAGRRPCAGTLSCPARPPRPVRTRRSIPWHTNGKGRAG